MRRKYIVMMRFGNSETFNLDSDDTIDKDNGVSVNDLSGEWVGALSNEDLDKLITILD